MAEMQEFSVEEREILEEFRSLFSKDLDKERLNNDVFLLRWLIARDFDLEKAETMLRNALKWRHEHKIDGLVHEDSFPKKYPVLYPYEFLAKDKDGRPACYLPFGQWDIRGACDRGEKQQLIRWMDKFFETGIYKCSQSKWKSDHTKCHSQMVLITDTAGFSWRQLMSRTAIESIVEIVLHFDQYYPETMHRIFVINAPRVFYALWAIIRPLLPTKTLEKISIHGTNPNEWKKIIEQVIEPTQLETLLEENQQFKITN